MNNTYTKNRSRFVPALFLLLLLAVGAAITPAQSRSEVQPERTACATHLGTLPVVQGQTLPSRLNILSWNIQKGSNSGWRGDLRRLGASADLRFIQEAALAAHLAEVWPGGPVYQSFAQGYTTPRDHTGVMTLSSRAPTMQCNFSHKEPWLGTPKAATATEHAIEGRRERLLAINLHAVNFTLGLEDLRAQLAPLVELLARHRGPVILAGDFNTWSAARAQLVESMLRGAGLQPLSFHPDMRTTAFGHALDHIYVRDMLAEETRIEVVGSSDHNPLLARLRILDVSTY